MVITPESYYRNRKPIKDDLGDVERALRLND